MIFLNRISFYEKSQLLGERLAKVKITKNTVGGYEIEVDGYRLPAVIEYSAQLTGDFPRLIVQIAMESLEYETDEG